MGRVVPRLAVPGRWQHCLFWGQWEGQQSDHGTARLVCDCQASQLTGPRRPGPLAGDASNPAVTGPRRGWASGGALDVRHQPPGTTTYIYCNYGHNHNDAASIVVKAS